MHSPLIEVDHYSEPRASGEPMTRDQYYAPNQSSVNPCKLQAAGFGVLVLGMGAGILASAFWFWPAHDSSKSAQKVSLKFYGEAY